jgi:hypothetical protein
MNIFSLVNTLQLCYKISQSAPLIGTVSIAYNIATSAYDRFYDYYSHSQSTTTPNNQVIIQPNNDYVLTIECACLILKTLEIQYSSSNNKINKTITVTHTEDICEFELLKGPSSRYFSQSRNSETDSKDIVIQYAKALEVELENLILLLAPTSKDKDKKNNLKLIQTTNQRVQFLCEKLEHFSFLILDQ